MMCALLCTAVLYIHKENQSKSKGMEASRKDRGDRSAGARGVKRVGEIEGRA